MSVVIIKVGERREVKRKFLKGYQVEDKARDRLITFDADTEVTVVQEFGYKYPLTKTDLEWLDKEIQWTTPEPEPVQVQEERPPEVVMGFWARLWARLTGRGLPKATLVKG